MRHCAALGEHPRLELLELLELYIESYGACADPVDLSLSLSVDDVRLEADPGCAPQTR